MRLRLAVAPRTSSGPTCGCGSVRPALARRRLMANYTAAASDRRIGASCRYGAVAPKRRGGDAHATRAGEKLREQGLVAGRLAAFVHIDPPPSCLTKSSTR